jgi:hypothetical protein
MIELLEYKASKIVFYREVTNIEFVEKQLGGIYVCNNPTKRDKMLFKHGEKIFKRHPHLVYSVEGGGPILTSDEIKELIAAIEKRDDDEPDFEDVKNGPCPAQFSHQKPRQGRGGLTQEEINQLLYGIECNEEGKTQVLSQREMDELLTLIK